jgi:hypothetical protein
MGQRASQPNGRSPAPQGRVRSANVPGTRAGNPSANTGSPSGNKSPTKSYRNGTASAGTLPDRLATGWPAPDEWMRSTRTRTITGSLRCRLPCSGEPWARLSRAGTSTARDTPAFGGLSTCAPLLGQRGLAICCVVSRSDSVKLTEDFASRFSGVASQLLERAGVSVMDARPTARATIGLTFANRSLSPGCDRETNTKSQGDLSCRRNKRTRLPRSVRLPYENRSGDRIW